jgi:hypothetical protein
MTITAAAAAAVWMKGSKIMMTMMMAVQGMPELPVAMGVGI